MQRRCGWLTAIAITAGLCLVWAASPAEAQRRGGNASRSPTGRDRDSNRARDFMLQPYGAFGGPSARDFNPPRFSTFSSGLLEQNFAIMRATSPNPRLYMGGQLNPSRRPSFSGGFFGGHYGGGFYGGGYYGGGYPVFGYDTYGYAPVPGIPLYPSLYSLYGRAFSPYVPSERVVIIQREVVVPRAESRRERDYYLEPRGERRAEEGLSDALGAVRAAWLNGDIERFKARVRDDGKVRIYLRGEYKYSVSAADFAQMTRDAMARIDTTAFELDAPRVEEDRAFVSGKHVYVDPDGAKREVYVSYVLERHDGRWKIVEAGSGSSRITRHTDGASGG